MLNSTLSIPQVVDPAIIKAFDQVKYQLSQKKQYPMFPYTEYALETDQDAMSSLSGYGPGTLTIEGQQYGIDYKYQGYKKTLVVRKYTKRVPYTEELNYYLQKRSAKGVYEVNSMLRGMVSALDSNWDIDFAKMFYLGAGTTFITGGDGVSLINASHPIRKPGSTAISNIVTVGATTNPVMNTTSIKQAFIQIDRFKDDANQLVAPATNKAIVCSRQLLETAFRNKYSEYGPDTANLGFGEVSPTIAAQVGYSFKVLPLHWMPDAYANYWFAVDLDKMKEMVVLAKLWEPRMYDRLDQKDGVTNLLASTIYGPNPIDWRWIVGSTGANNLS